MPPLKSALLVFVAVTAAAAQSADPLLSETRLTVHTLLREDIFAGFRSDNMDRFAKGEQNIEILLKERPGERAAAKLEFGNGGVAAITGGTFALFADRLPEKHRAAAWSQAYDNYAMLWKQQGAGIEKLPLHHKGEVLAGLTQSAQRTGRSDEAALYLDKMLTLLPDTPYEAMAKQWKSDPASAATTNLTCKGCHGPGRLANRLEALKQQ
jgi:hypothetical protein